MFLNTLAAFRVKKRHFFIDNILKLITWWVRAELVISHFTGYRLEMIFYAKQEMKNG
jgi:hypothetical protein